MHPIPSFKEILKDFIESDSYYVYAEHYKKLSDAKNSISDSKLAEEFLVNIKIIFDIKTQLSASHSIANTNHAEEVWLNTIDRIYRHDLSLNALLRVLKVSAHFDDVDELFYLLDKSHSTAFKHSLLLSSLESSFNKINVDESDGFNEIKLQFKDIIFSTEVSLRFLIVLENIFHEFGNKGTLPISASSLSNVLKEIFTNKLYLNENFISMLERHSLVFWGAMVKRVLLYQILSLDPTSQLGQDIAENLITIFKSLW